MANVSKTVEIIFGGKDDLSKVVDQIGRKFDDFDDLSSKITGPLADAGAAVLKIDAALAALAIGGMALALKTSSDFNSSFGLISTSVTASGKDLEKFRSDILDYSATSVKTLDDINAALYTAAQAGVKYTDAIEFMGKSEQLAVANKANLNTTVDLLTGTMNAYGFTLKDVGHLNDVFFQSTLIGKQTIDELGQSMGMVVGIAANSGVSFEELSGAIATLTAKGMGTAEAITAMKAVITTIVSPSKEAAQAASDLGLNFSLTELNAKGFAGMMTEIMQKTGGSKEKMVELFSEIRAMNGALMLTGDGMKFFNGAMEQIANSAGASEAAYEKMVATFSNQAQMIKNQAVGLLVDLGTTLEPMAANIGSGLSTLIQGIKIGVDSGAFDPLFSLLDQVSADLGVWLADVGKAFPDALANIDFASLIDAFRNLGEAFSEYFGGLDLTDVDDLSSALQSVVDVVAGLINITSGMVDAFRPFIETVVEFVQSMAAGGTETQETVGKVMAFAMAIEKLGLGLAAAILIINEYQLSISGIFNTLAGGVQIFWNGFQLLIDGIKGAIIIVEGIFLELIDSMTFGMFPGMDRLKASLADVGEELSKSIMQNGMDAGKGLDVLLKGVNQLAGGTEKATEKTEEFGKTLKDIPPQTEPEIILHHEEAKKRAVEVAQTIDTVIPESKDIVIWPTYGDEIKGEKKTLEMDVKVDLAKIKEQSDIVQKAMEWKAKVDIAQIEAATKEIEAAFGSVDVAVKSTGDTLVSMIGIYADAIKSGSSGSVIIEQIEKENKRRDESLRLQKELTEATLENMRARTKALESGQAMIQIDGAGLQPHLEAFMFEILAAIQIRANAEGAQFLVGI